MTGDTHTIPPIPQPRSAPSAAPPAPPTPVPPLASVPPRHPTAAAPSATPIGIVTAPTARDGQQTPLARTTAARELGLKRGEFELAVLLGHIRTVPDPAGGRRRVSRDEIDRVRAARGFPEDLRAQIGTVGTADGAALMEITRERFARLARAGVLTPIKFYVNRYRAVVWLYLAEELRQFAAAEVNAPLLDGRTPDTMRARLATGVDLRARTWRRRHVGLLLRQLENPWERAAVIASFLDPRRRSGAVRDPYERAYLTRLKPEPLTRAAPESPTAHIVERITTADDPEEINWLRASLTLSLMEARRHRPAPRPDLPPIGSAPPAREHARAEPPPHPQPTPHAQLPSRAYPHPALPPASPASGPVSAAQGAGPEAADPRLSQPAGPGRSQEPRGLLKWLRRRRV
ncbi:DUF6397 family protein [Streptomyces sp. G45]|uniref:DUF6397 family protein n=1 Tax=Streptomyces sp. G45 TaxID=3406627 RepID=UPI003C250E25